MTRPRADRAVGKIRVEGSPDDVATFVAIVRRVLVVTSLSEFYPNRRGIGGRGRVYLDVLEPGAEGSVSE